MPRTKEFSETEALNQAMDIFWEKGYEGTSLQDLIGAMEISKSSFYEAFGSKHELFVAAIENYIDKEIGAAVAFLDAEPSGRAAIEKMIRKTLEASCGENKRGCFLCNCAVEMAQHDPVSAEYVARGLERTVDAFVRTIERGQKAGEISKDRDPRALARFLLNTEIGVLVWSRGGADRETLTNVVDMALLALE
ncbi:MAG: TetR/AcrR family transcriptional regulator [Nitrospinaceae bacterium]|jgi:TetR/AcrR family transcriptional regulator, transcriptional repressor for nem operon|nr:TetR/AcrR family transcriptional regulator [Nitrospinaceae bacterium]MBT3433651.1 TetR/AcrR family transcriptional regulator [Nitrospinaceae bacterium]MBT3822874.1 TetR/AcrR family transcriptional regulator [Nitrospinaceae bacterium]MBT4093579.1 TetR/AcrR family transcriptional regulator [Nitrospinaceae bacterium]MBT4431104.1 TetR/AcrR family transcriptional regulator [Nitrospinaceae bacterium]